jgi:hypothetical protein
LKRPSQCRTRVTNADSSAPTSGTRECRSCSLNVAVAASEAEILWSCLRTRRWHRTSVVLGAALDWSSGKILRRVAVSATAVTSALKLPQTRLLAVSPSSKPEPGGNTLVAFLMSRALIRLSSFSLLMRSAFFMSLGSVSKRL